MGKRQRDCSRCGAPVGFIARELCCRCHRSDLAADATDPCPGCGEQRILRTETGLCKLCSRRCADCGAPFRDPAAERCRPCLRRLARAAQKEQCPRCGREGFLRQPTGWCGFCSRPRPAKAEPRTCTACGASTGHPVRGKCSACWQRDPQRPYVRARHLGEELAEIPLWFDGFVEFIASRHCPARAVVLLSALGQLLKDGHPNHPTALVQRATLPGRSMGTLARSLESFFVAEGRTLPGDHEQRLAAGRRHRRVEAVPAPLRAAARAFEHYLLTTRDRARRAATLPRVDSTLEGALSIVRDFALFSIEHQDKHDWALCTRTDIEEFLARRGRSAARTLSVLKQFFRWARNRKIILIDPAAGIPALKPPVTTGPTLPLAEQRRLFHRWCSEDGVHPHESLTGMLALLHGANSAEIRLLRVQDVEHLGRTIRLGKRPYPTPLDPATWACLERCLRHRDGLRTANEHVLVTKGTKADHRPASPPYLSHVLDGAGIRPRALRTTRLSDLVNTMDVKLVAVAFGMDSESTLRYLADHVDPTRLPVNPAAFGAT